MLCEGTASEMAEAQATNDGIRSSDVAKGLANRRAIPFKREVPVQLWQLREILYY